MGRTADRQFRFQPKTTRERIAKIESENQLCDPTPADVDKKAFLMRPREEHKEIGPAIFRNNSKTTLDLIRSRIASERTVSSPSGITTMTGFSFRKSRQSEIVKPDGTRYNAIQSLKEHTKKQMQSKSDLSKTFAFFDKAGKELVTPREMVLAAKAQNAKSLQRTRSYFQAARALAN